MDVRRFNDTLSGLDDAALAELEASVREAREGKRRTFDLNDIKPGMKPEDEAAFRAEIKRVLGQ